MLRGVQGWLVAPCSPLLWADALVYSIGSVPDGANASSAHVFLGVMLWVGSHERSCCVPIASAAGQEEEEEQACFSIPGEPVEGQTRAANQTRC